jgi:site-specific recombinase XerD
VPLAPAGITPAQLGPKALTRAQLDTLVAALIRRGDSPHTKRNYRTDLARFFGWLDAEGLDKFALGTLQPDDLDRYRAWLIEPVEGKESRLSVASANRSLVVVRGLFDEAQRRGLLAVNPSAWLRSVRGGGDTGQPALTLAQVRELLSHLDAEVESYPDKAEAIRVVQEQPGLNKTKTAMLALDASKLQHFYLSALRDRVALHLMIRNGLRRDELAQVRVADFGEQGGHSVLTIRSGKGRKRRLLKIQPDTMRAVRAWTEAAGLTGADPLLLPIAKGGHMLRRPLSGEAVREIVGRRLPQIGITDRRYGAHGLRATFATLTLAAGAPIQKVARAMGHAKTDTTAAYDRRRDDLDSNASDWLKL